MFRLRIIPVVSLLGLAACGGSSVAETAVHRPAHVDTLVSRDEALRRFQTATPRVDSLSGGAADRDTLVARFVRALETRDTSAFRRMLLDRSEFAFLYYPTTPQALPPYELSPDLLWFLLSTGSDKGLARALEKMGGQRLRYSDYECTPKPSREGLNVVWGPCAVTIRGPKGARESERLFGLIIERQGQYKFVSYTNRL